MPDRSVLSRIGAAEDSSTIWKGLDRFDTKDRQVTYVCFSMRQIGLLLFPKEIYTKSFHQGGKLIRDILQSLGTLAKSF